VQTIRLLPAKMAILRFEPSAPFAVPVAAGAGFFSLIRTEKELSIVMEAARAPRKAPVKSSGWRLFEVEGPFALDAIGVLASITAPLAAAGVSIFALSTHDTDYFMVSGRQAARAVKALRGAGHTVFES
jgi:hypothetical protein